jgi:DNA-binding IclR family transcriptional regulator
MQTELVPGAQVVGRSVQLLKLVSKRTRSGHFIAELVAKSGLARPTVYRLLAALQAAGLVEQDATTRRWHLGPEAFVLGTLAAGRFNIERLAHEALLRIADETGESAFLSIRRGNESVCLVREEGTYPIRTHVLQPGDRLPLGVGSAGLAMLAMLPDAEVDRLLDSIRPQLKSRFTIYSAKLIGQLIAETRSAGFAINRGLLLPGSWGIAASICDDANVPFAALSITAVESRLQGERQIDLGRLLVQETRRLTSLLQSASGGPGKRRAA